MKKNVCVFLMAFGMFFSLEGAQAHAQEQTATGQQPGMGVGGPVVRKANPLQGILGDPVIYDHNGNPLYPADRFVELARQYAERVLSQQNNGVPQAGLDLGGAAVAAPLTKEQQESCQALLQRALNLVQAVNNKDKIRDNGILARANLVMQVYGQLNCPTKGLEKLALSLSVPR